MSRYLFALAGPILLTACSPRQAENTDKKSLSEVNAAAPKNKIDFNKNLYPEPIPVAIRGKWAATIQDCKNEDADSRINIGSNWIGGPEYYGIMQISSWGGIPDVDESFAVRFAMSGIGSTWDKEFVFAWYKSNHNELLMVEPETTKNMYRRRRRTIYVRCL